MSRYSRTEAHRLRDLVNAAGGQLPTTLTNLLDTAQEVRSTPTAPTKDAITALTDAAAVGKATPAKITTTFTDASTQAAQKAQADQTKLAAEIALYERFRQELAAGAADEILNSLRPAFDHHIAGIRAIAESIDVAITPEAFLTIATPDTLTLWQSIDIHVTALNRIADVTSRFTHNGTAQVIAQPRDPGNHLIDGLRRLNGIALFCTSDDIDPNRATKTWGVTALNGRNSAWFQLSSVAQLRTVAEASERLNTWCAAEWQAWENTRAASSGTYRDGQHIQDTPRPNPFDTSVKPGRSFQDVSA